MIQTGFNNELQYNNLKHFIYLFFNIININIIIIIFIQDSPEFDLVFDHRSDQWVAASSAEKCMFIQILYHLCQHYWRKQIDLSVTAPPVGQKPTTSTTPPSISTTTTPPSTATTTPASTSNEQTPGLKKKQKKGRDAPRPTEFVNCQSKLLGGKKPLNY